MTDSIGSLDFSRLLTHLTSGHRLIVHPGYQTNNDASSITAISLASLIPWGCVNSIFDVHDLSNKFKYNIISCSSLNPLQIYEDEEAKIIIILVHSKGFNQFDESDLSNSFQIDSSMMRSRVEMTLTKNPNQFVESLHFSIFYNFHSLKCFLGQHLYNRLNFFSSPQLACLKMNEQGDLIETASEVNPNLSNSSILSNNCSSLSNMANFFQIPPAIGSLQGCKFPQIVNTYNQILFARPQINADTLMIALKCVKNEWINKAKLAYTYQECKISNNNQNKGMGNSEIYSKITRKSKEILECIGCGQQDDPVIAFFMKGLSALSKKDVCHPSQMSGNFSGTRCNSVVSNPMSMGNSSVTMTNIDSNNED